MAGLGLACSAVVVLGEALVPETEALAWGRILGRPPAVPSPVRQSEA